ncbi:thioredoxin [Aliidiomarina sedimenti]|uniref:Thioredoxin n=2 Tax=Aliidiomarina TaxID=1249554 RepID=A0A432WGH1_9GAMM|nr:MULTISPECIES: thioredoxin [Aliidiomarina]RUO29019.1 thioredoxin [Aliidiomarina sedimenti]RUO32926.1 thioredoxin [Aliidiomarina soli]
MQAQNIIDINEQNAQQVLIQGSQEKVVLIDFWADWCEPCKQLTPVLEKIAADYPHDLILAKINCEEQQAIAAQFGVQSLPTLVVFKDGQPVDGLSGAQPESAIRQMLANYLPQPQDEALALAKQALGEENFEVAYEQAKQAFDLAPDDAAARLILADAAASIGHTEQAKELLKALTIADQDSYYQQILAKIKLAEDAADSPEVKALEDELATQPDNLELQLKLAVQYHQVRRHGEALDLLFKVLQTDMNFADAKKTTLDVINNLPAGDPLAASARRKLYSMLY